MLYIARNSTTKHVFVLNHFNQLKTPITRTNFNFPWHFELSGCICTCDQLPSFFARDDFFMVHKIYGAELERPAAKEMRRLLWRLGEDLNNINRKGSRYRRSHLFKSSEILRIILQCSHMSPLHQSNSRSEKRQSSRGPYYGAPPGSTQTL